jgi:hypothetical protein
MKACPVSGWAFVFLTPNQEGDRIMMHQEPRRLNTTEVVIPQEACQESSAHLPALMPSAPLDWPVERFTQALDRREVNRKALLKWIQSNLQASIDYGQIHFVGKDKCRLVADGRVHECLDPRHWSKPSLWKPGAEKICGMLGLIPRFPNLAEYEKAALGTVDVKVIILKCELHTGNGFVAAEGTGARRVDQDRGDINKSLKMAVKSAHIDATLRVAGISELFTQDIEDMIGDKVGKEEVATGNVNGNHPAPPPQAQPAQTPPPPAKEPANNGQNQTTNGQSHESNRITSKQHTFIMNLIQTAKMTKSELNKHCVEAYGSVVDHITRHDASSLIDWLRNR